MCNRIKKESKEMLKKKPYLIANYSMKLFFVIIFFVKYIYLFKLSKSI